MNFHTQPEWQNIEVQSINRLSAHSPWDSPHTMSLDGKWKFKLCEHPGILPAGFYLPDYNDSGWRLIDVPGCWELQGESEPIYTNWVYPFTDEPGAHELTPDLGGEFNYGAGMNPPYLPDRIPTGLYRRTFTLPEHFVGKKLILRFGGVESGFYVWVNGQSVGYSQDSKLAAEFDITRYTYAGENVITVQVMRFTDATWLEDQDYWHLSGIFRSVTLISKPRMHIEDVFVNAEASGDLTVDVKVTRVNGCAEALVRLHIYDPDGNIIYKEKRAPQINVPSFNDKDSAMPGHARFKLHIDNPKLWSCETPVLYRMHLALLDPMSGDAADRDKLRFGFRTVKIEDGILRLNGQRVIVRGVNRHEHCIDSGRYVPHEQMKKEVLLMKQLGINAVRSCHYSDDPYFYDLCDEYGLMAVCETNLETHGVGAMLTNDPEWAESFLQRARRMAQIHKNHPSIIVWSLGNESGTGPNHAAMAAWLRAYDRSRPVQYESGDPDASISDIRCPMYPSRERIVELLTSCDTRPVILCEYAYQILNSGGGLTHFRELTEKYPRFQGGFVWDFQDKALWQTDEDGNRFAGYGGDFYESVVETREPRFMCLNGIVQHDLRLKPVAEELRYVYRPVFIERKAGGFVLKNRFMALALVKGSVPYTICSDGEKVSEGAAEFEDLNAMSETKLNISLCDVTGDDAYINFEVPLPGGESYTQQFSLMSQSALPRKQKPVRAQYDDSHGMLTISGQDFRMEILKQSGCIVSLQKGGHEYMLNGLTEIAVRGLSGMNAQSGWGCFEDWDAFVHENCMRRLISLNASVLSDGRVRIERVTRLTSRTVHGAALDIDLRMLVSGNGNIQINSSFILSGIASVERLGLTFMLPEDMENVTWFGRGPGESYPDRKASQLIGKYTRSVTDMHFPFNPPSENGGHEDVRYIKIETNEGRALRFTAHSPVHFDAHHYTVGDLRDARHDHELIKRRQTILHIDTAHAGIGGDMAWSTVADPACTVTPGEYNLGLEIELV